MKNSMEMNWISVKDELPPDEIIVLVFARMLDSYGEKHYFYRDFGCYSTQIDPLSKTGWVTDAHDDEMISPEQEESITVLYWMPLTEFPPETEGMR